MSTLRILVILPLYGGSLPIGKYCVAALRKLGHSVRVFEAQKLYPAFQGLKELDLSVSRINALENGFLKFVSQAIWSQAEEQKPQIVLALAQAPVDKVLLKKFKQAGMSTVMWFVEDYRVFNYWQVFAPLYDAFAVIQKEPFLSELKRVGQSHAFYLPLAALPDFHKPLKLSPAEIKEYGSDISFLGAGYPNRRLAFRPLAGKNFKIWGSDWDEEQTLAKNIQRNGQRIHEDESVKIYNASKINLNLHSSLQIDSLVSNGDFVNPRTFELAAMGAFQLTDKRALLPELFAEDEIATFSDIPEFYAKIDYFLAHPEEREKFAKKARERVLHDHTYEKRMEALINYMQKNFGPFTSETQPGELELFENIEPELREKIKALVARLGLAPNAPFQDVAARLRQQEGELDDLETSILFLGEWRKQYQK